MEIEWDREHGELVNSPLSFYFKVGISASTLLLILQLTEYYYSKLYFTVAVADSLRPTKEPPFEMYPNQPTASSINQSEKDEVQVAMETTDQMLETSTFSPTERTPLLSINRTISSAHGSKKRTRIYINMWTILRSSSLPRNVSLFLF